MAGCAGARIIVLASALFFAGCDSTASETPPSDREQLGLMTSLPIYWPETAAFGDILSEDGEPSWSRTVLEERYELVPLDALTADTIGALDLVMMAQPRALSPQENVALDDWVRAGGRLLLFADPALTFHSRYALGDARRPLDVALLSPILARWGLELTFDPAQEEGERSVAAYGGTFPVNQAGVLSAIDTDAPADCAILDHGVVARCAIGEGQVLIVADAALLEDHEPLGTRSDALRLVTGAAFSDSGFVE